MYGGEDEEAMEVEEEEISQDDAWAVISAYFKEKGLVRQQLDSFNEFIQDTMQMIVTESGLIDVRPDVQHVPGRRMENSQVQPLDSSAASHLRPSFEPSPASSFFGSSVRLPRPFPGVGSDL